MLRSTGDSPAQVLEAGGGCERFRIGVSPRPHRTFTGKQYYRRAVVAQSRAWHQVALPDILPDTHTGAAHRSTVAPGGGSEMSEPRGETSSVLRRRRGQVRRSHGRRAAMALAVRKPPCSRAIERASCDAGDSITVRPCSPARPGCADGCTVRHKSPDPRRLPSST